MPGVCPWQGEEEEEKEEHARKAAAPEASPREAGRHRSSTPPALPTTTHQAGPAEEGAVQSKPLPSRAQRIFRAAPPPASLSYHPTARPADNACLLRPRQAQTTALSAEVSRCITNRPSLPSVSSVPSLACVGSAGGGALCLPGPM